MKEVIELNKRLMGQLGKCFSDGELILGRDDQPDALKRLPAAYQADIGVLRERINSVVPNDFKYGMCLGDDEPGFMLEYADGPQMGFFQGRDWQPDRSIVDQLKEMNWDAERQRAMAGCQIFDEMVAKSKNAPSCLPSTKEIQKAFRDEMKEFVKTKRREGTRVHVLLWRDDEGIREETFEDMQSFCWDLPNIMTVQYLVVTVVADGKPLTVEKIEALKKQALKELEGMPISHAKASGKL